MRLHMYEFPFYFVTSFFTGKVKCIEISCAVFPRNAKRGHVASAQCLFFKTAKGATRPLIKSSAFKI